MPDTNERDLLLSGETLEGREEVRGGWMAVFPPTDYREQRLVDQLIWNDRLLQRATRWYVGATAELPEWPSPESPSNEQRKLEGLQRHRAQHERAFHRSLNALQQLWKSKQGRPSKEISRTPEPAALKPVTKKPNDKLHVINQWVEIRVVGGVARVGLFPPNEVVREVAGKLKIQPDEVYRHFHFPDGIPAEYDWVAEAGDLARESGGLGNQRMTFAHWLTQIEKEEEAGGHLLPCGGNLPRHESHGTCDCAVCVQNEWLREAS